MKNPLTLLIGIIIALVLLAYMFFFQVRYDQVAVLATFGRATEADIHQARPRPYLRWPWPIQRVEAYPTTLQLLENQSEQILTADNYAVIVSSYIAWRVDDPLKFFQNVETIGAAQERLRSTIANTQSVLRSFRFSDLVNVDPEKVQLPEIEKQMLAQMVADVQRQNLGVVVEQFGVRRILLPAETTAKVNEAQRSYREKLAQGTRSAGEAEAKGIESEAQYIRDQIMAFAESRATEIRAIGDKASAQYVEVFNQDEEFAIFLRRLNAYETFLSNFVTVFLPSEEVMAPGQSLLEREAATKPQ